MLFLLQCEKLIKVRPEEVKAPISIISEVDDGGLIQIHDIREQNKRCIQYVFSVAKTVRLIPFKRIIKGQFPVSRVSSLEVNI